MAAPRLGESLDERGRLRVEVEEPYVPPCRLELCDRLRQRGKTGRGLDVERDRHTIAVRFREVSRRLGDQWQREVVDRVVARILERRERDALAGTGNAADQQKVHAVSAQVYAVNRSRPSASADAR